MPNQHLHSRCRLAALGIVLLVLGACAQTPGLGARSPAGEAAPSVNLDTRSMAARWRALNRLGYGPSPALLQSVQSAPDARQWAHTLLDAAWAASQRAPALPPTLAEINLTLPQLFEGAKKERLARAAVTAASPVNEALPNDKRFDFSQPTEALHFNRTMVNKAVAWRLASCSDDSLENPLLARMTEFWFNHFNIYQNKGPVRPFGGHYALHVARAHALGKFEDLVLASAQHPAMLFYLDQWQSVDPQSARDNRGLNENYARELLELHTLGVHGGYTQDDVRALARVLTGWTISAQSATGFQFVSRSHDADSKTVLGQTYPASPAQAGQSEGEQAIRFLARQPATAKRITLRLAQYFVADTPPPDLLAAMEARFLASGGDIRELMRVLLDSPAFWASENRLFKTPYEFACTALRTVRAGEDRSKWLQAWGYAAAAGQPIHQWQTPDGYPFDSATWLAPEALTRRLDFALNMARNAPEWDALYPLLSPQSRSAVLQQGPAQRLGFVLGSPEFLYK